MYVYDVFSPIRYHAIIKPMSNNDYGLTEQHCMAGISNVDTGIRKAIDCIAKLVQEM